MTNIEDFPTIDDMSALWLTKALRAGGVPDADVTAFTAERVGTGQIARCFRLTLQSPATDSSTPQSVIAKVPSDDEDTLKAVAALPIYRREVEFYTKYDPAVGISTPHCYFAGIRDDQQFLLLLEDMSPAEAGDQMQGCSVEVTRRAVLELASLHGPTWNLPGLTDPEDDWYPLQIPFSHRFQIYADTIESFIEMHSDSFREAETEVMRKLALSEDPVFKLDPQCYALVHLDYRLDNLLIGGGDDPRLTVVDWQTYSVDNPLNDVAYFISSSLPVETRREVEEDIVREYFDRIVELGVTDFSWDQCWHKYRLGSFYGFTIIMVAAVTVERTERGDAMFKLLAGRHVQQALDLQAAELLR